MSDNFPPPPSPPHRHQQPPWPAPPGWDGGPPPRKSGAGLVVALSVGGGVLTLALLGTLLYFAGQAVMGSSPGPGPYSSGEALPGQEPVPPPSPAPTGTEAEEDVRISACTVDSLTAWPAAGMEIVNGSGSAADYVVTVEFVDQDGTRVADGIVGVLGLAPGQSAKKKAQGLEVAPGDVKCRITEVLRTASAGCVPSRSTFSPRASVTRG
ncbi:hypothetical protein [Streptomyces fulvorobeus]|uniref:Uncharacterized protein n=1 Tax=Streptomyces fulvorobeus TaxID=284028 RepID=A0A7J0CBW3_9ACTN|nr:hypothetical protein [Streptomyces fulvorobeus]NYE43539.1 hypothetical protein [Streptomyces fulvorobeus]GFN00016.1 hypothetical protein Sfulv_48260 [Streptomyces fulvorobeus]